MSSTHFMGTKTNERMINLLILKACQTVKAYLMPRVFGIAFIFIFRFLCRCFLHSFYFFFYGPLEYGFFLERFF